MVMLNDDESHFHRLTEYVHWHFDSQKEDRDRHWELASYMLNEFYPVTGQRRRNLWEVSIPLISMTARAWSRYTISKSPRVGVTPVDPAMRSWAESAEASVNQRIEEGFLARELREFTQNSFCSIGVMHVGPVYEGTPDEMRMDLETKAIDRGDWLCDFSSPFPETCDIQGHRFRMPLVDVREHPYFDPEAASKVYGSGESRNQDRTEFYHGYRFNDLYQFVELACVFERRRNKIVYFPWDQREIKLAEFDYHGPTPSPYVYLYYEKPPNCAKPIAPLSHLAKKFRSCNILDVKAMDQSLTSKGALFYTNASKEEASRMVKLKNNESVLAESGQVRYGHIGGPAPDLVAMQQKQRADFSWNAGGLETYAGLQPGAPTLGQERLLHSAANQMLADMGEYAQLAMQDLCHRLFWYDNRDPDPNPTMLTKRHRRGTYQTYWTKEHREFVRANRFKAIVEPYSYVMRTPENRLADTLGALQIFQSMRAEAAAQGIMLDVEAVIRNVAKAKNLPELYEVLIMNQDPQRLAQLLGGGDRPQPDSGNPRRYERTSRSDGSGAEMEMMRAFNRGGGGDLVAA